MYLIIKYIKHIKMVRNTSGGSRHKKQARKNHNAESVHKKTRLKDAKGIVTGKHLMYCVPFYVLDI